MERVLILGSPGAGKSTLSRELARLTGRPLYHLDKEYWQPGWVEPSPEEWQARLVELCAEPRWVIDGNYGGSMELRLRRADTVVLLDYPTWLCLYRSLRRFVRYRGSARPDVPEGCPERLDLEFLAYIWRFRRDKTPKNESRLARFGGTVHRFTHPREAAAWLARLGERGSTVEMAYNRPIR